MPDRSTYEKLLIKGVRVDKCPFNSYDALAGEDDLSALFETLLKYRDVNGNHPVITANCVVANPDFEKIRRSNFEEYYYEPITDTFKRYSSCKGSFNLWKQGRENLIFHPQFHGREHLNVSRWMSALKKKFPETLLGFENGLFGLGKNITTEHRESYLEALAVDSYADKLRVNEIIEDGLKLFKDLLGYSSVSFIAPNYVWSGNIEKVLFNNGIRYIQGQRKQIVSDFPGEGKSTIGHYLGESNKYGQIYLVRNCQFEPSLYRDIDSVAECIAQINSAFKWGKPAVITTHRLNFIGSIDEVNRTRNIFLLNKLLVSVIKRWPDVEFVSSEQLGDIISNNY